MCDEQKICDEQKLVGVVHQDDSEIHVDESQEHEDLINLRKLKNNALIDTYNFKNYLDKELEKIHEQLVSVQRDMTMLSVQSNIAIKNIIGYLRMML